MRTFLARFSFARMSGFTTSASGEIGKITYDQVCRIVQSSKSGEKGPVLIDVRPPEEIHQSGGSIPTSHNIPLAEIPTAFQLPESEFKERFGFDKPSKSADSLVFYCKAGMRGMSAAREAAKAGYASLCYFGSWSEWKEKCMAAGKSPNEA